jgi:hypothetical protein
MERRTLKRKKFRKERSMKLFSSGTSIVVEKVFLKCDEMKVKLEYF